MSLQLVSLASGSHGNCTYIGNKSEGILIDCGISFSRYLEAMKRADLNPSLVKGIWITHEHGDHVGGLKTLENGYRNQGWSLEIWMHPDTHAASKVKPSGYQPFVSKQAWGAWEVRTIPVPHDCAYPVVIQVQDQEDCVGVMTDFGKGTYPIQQAIRECTRLLLEFNHEESWLMQHPDYSWQLRQRIRGNHGHLSNKQALDLYTYSSSKLKQVIGGHLSNKTNTIEQVQQCLEWGSQQLGIHPLIQVAADHGSFRRSG